MIGLSPRRRIWVAALALIVALVAAIVPADSLGTEGDYTFSYVVPPQPRTPAMGIRPIPRPPGPPPWARNAAANQAGSSGASTTATASSTGYQTTGVISATVLAVDFDDNVAETHLSHYDDMLFDPEGYPDNIKKSMRSYYHEVSYYDGTAGLDVAGEVYGEAKSDPSNGVDWIRAPESYRYYTSRNYGFGRYPRNAQKLTEDAVAAADRYVDFSAFTTYEGSEGGVSGTFVSALFVVHAGPGAEVTGSRNDIWSHAWVTRQPILTDDGVYVYRYIMMAEDSPMGTFGHEFGHTLGLPDLYDYDGSSAGIGAWGMMAYGTWNDGGHTPAHMCAWSKIHTGWVNPTVIADHTSVDIPQVEGNATIYQLWTNSGGTVPEYFLVENRQKTLFDAYLPGAGLLIWHVDDNVSNNDDETHYRVALEQADGKLDLENWTNGGDDGDPFPGSTNNRAFVDTSAPNSRTYDGLASGVAVTNISDSGLMMIATMTAGGDTPPGVSIVDPDEGQTVSGDHRVLVSAIDDNAVAKVELSIDGGEPYIDITSNFDGTHYYYDWDTTADAEGSHTLRARATDDSTQSNETALVNVTVDNVNDPPVADAGPDQTVVDADGNGVEVTLDASGGGPIAFDAASSANTTSDSNTLSWSHTTSGSDRIMIVGVTTRNNRAVTSVTCGGVDLTRIRRDVLGVDVGTELWYLIAPPLGTQTVSLTTEDDTTIEAGATTWTGVGQTAATALGHDAGGTGLGTTASVDVASASDEVVVDVVGTQNAGATVSVGPGQTERWNQLGTAGVGAASSEPGAATVTMSWDLAKVENWSISAVALLSAGGSYDPDGIIEYYEWDIDGDGTTDLWGETVTAEFAVWSHTVTLKVTDDEGATDTDDVIVTVIEGADNVHIGDLDGSSTSEGRTWTAIVTVDVHGGNHTAVGGATVSGTWSGGASGPGSCKTGGNGQCSVEQPGILKRNSSATFTVDDVTYDIPIYDPTVNHDSDGGSDGTSIIVYKP